MSLCHCWHTLSYNIVACCLRTGVMIVPCDLPVHYYVLLYAIQKVHFIIMLISFSPQNERYNEVSVYVTSAPSLTVFRKHLKTYLFSRFFP